LYDSISGISGNSRDFKILTSRYRIDFCNETENAEDKGHERSKGFRVLAAMARMIDSGKKKCHFRGIFYAECISLKTRRISLF
jgi:hypothetical protein